MQVPLASARLASHYAPSNVLSLAWIDRESDIAANLQIGPTSLGWFGSIYQPTRSSCRSISSPRRRRRSPEELRAAAARARKSGPEGRVTAPQPGKPRGAAHARRAHPGTTVLRPPAWAHPPRWRGPGISPTDATRRPSVNWPPSQNRASPRSRHRRRPRRGPSRRVCQLLHKLGLRARLIRKCSSVPRHGRPEN